jgi:hypothetical protein
MALHVPTGEKSMWLTAPGKSCETGWTNLCQNLPSALGFSAGHTKLNPQPSCLSYDDIGPALH